MPALPAGQWHSLLAKHAKIWRRAAEKAAAFVEATLTDAPHRAPKLQPIPIKNAPNRPQLHQLARARQPQGRWISTQAWKAAARHFSSLAAPQTGQRASPVARSAYLSTSIGRHISRSSGRAPFASTLRPNLTGGTLGRSAGGYTLGSGRVGAARYFSHGPASPAHVVQNVSQGLRAFLLSGCKAQYSGIDPTTGEKRYRTVSSLQHETASKIRDLPRSTPGSYVDFRVNPTITALTSFGKLPGFPQSAAPTTHLNTDGLIDYLSQDFSRSLNDLAIILSDLKGLATLGDLLITYHKDTLRIHFPGCDLDTVESLCADLNIQRGIVSQDPDFDLFTGTETALLFPFAPDTAVHGQEPNDIDWRTMLSTPCTSDEAFSTASVSGFEDLDFDSGVEHENGAQGEADDWSSQDSFGSEAVMERDHLRTFTPHDPLEYQGLEGIFRFIQQCDAAVPSPRAAGR